MNKKQTNRLTKTLSFLKITLWGFVLAYGFPTYGQNEGRRYTVEVIVFKRLDAAAFNREIWRPDINLSYPANYQYLTTQEGGDFAILPQDVHQLGGFNYTLRRDENYQVLFHKAWQQTMANKQNAPSIILQGGKNIGNGKELQGYIKLHIARYLHLTTNLWFNGQDRSKQQGSTNQNLLIPELPGSTSDYNKDSVKLMGRSFSQEFSSSPVITFRERRRMRSGELHYIDHPLLGLLILVTPIES
jgi:hypothetical protein